MISIQGLTARQKSIMELMWQCATMQQVQALIAALPAPDARDAASMVLIAQLESEEEDGALDQYQQAALKCIAGAGR